MTELPVNVDSAYADDATHPDVKIHQQHHDFLHYLYNLFEQAIEDGTGTWDDGGIPFWVAGDGEFSIIDPGISGSPGPTGPQGRGFLFMGVWSSGTAYNVATSNSPEAYEVVQYGRHLYYALTDHTNSTPTTDANGYPTASANWGVFLTGGLDGATGVPGADGSQGPIGLTGPSGPSAEVGDIITSSGSTQTLDSADATYYKITLTDDCTINLADTTGEAASAMTIRLFQGVGAPWLVDFPDVSSWFTASGAAPVLGTTEGDATVIVVDHFDGEWFGYAPGVSATPPPETFPTLDFEEWGVGSSDGQNKLDTLGTATWVLNSAVQLGNKRGGVVGVVLTTDNSVTPPVPSLAGGGASAWTVIGSIAWGTGTVLRRLTLFAARDSSSSAAAQFTVTAIQAGVSYTNCVIKGVRSTGNVPSTWMTTMLGNFAVNNNILTGNSSAQLATLAALATGNRPIACLATNLDTTYTYDTNYAIIGSTQLGTGPTIELHFFWDATTTDTTPSTTTTNAVNWAMVAAEAEQGV